MTTVNINIKAQDKDKKQKTGIRGGYQSSAIAYEGSKPNTTKQLNTYYIGLFQDNKIPPILHFGRGIEYFQNNLKYSGNTYDFCTDLLSQVAEAYFDKALFTFEGTLKKLRSKTRRTRSRDYGKINQIDIKYLKE